MKKKFLYASIALAQGIFPASVFAQDPGELPLWECSDMNSCIKGPINTIITWMLGVAGLVAVAFLIIGGVRYIISAGNPTQTEGAKKTIIYALVGLAVIILSFALVKIVISLFGSGGA